MTKQTTAREKFIKLLLENPDLPIIAEVYSEVVSDNSYAWSYGDVSTFYITSLWQGNYRTWTLDDALEDVMEFLDYEFPKKVPDTVTPEDEKRLEKFIKELPWKKVIVLGVITPNSLQ